MATVMEVVERARGPLNDASARRYPDETLNGYVVEGLRYLRRQRPDLFLGRLADPMSVDSSDLAKIPVDDGFVMALADYAVARCQLHDTEAKAIEKAQAFLGLSDRAVK